MAKKQPAKLGDTVDLLRPYLERAMHDEEFRNDLRDAMRAARELYGPLSKSGGVKGSAKTIATDRKTQEQLMKAMEEIAGAAGSFQGKERRRRRATRAGTPCSSPGSSRARSTTRGRARRPERSSST